MPSLALQRWNGDRKLRLNEFDRQCGPIKTNCSSLDEENQRAFVMLLSAHFQGYCRDLHTECVQVLSDRLPQMKLIFQMLVSNRLLDKANTSTGTIRSDFRSLGIVLETAFEGLAAGGTKDFEARMKHVWHLNDWRNHCAHHNNDPPKEADPLTLENVRRWLASCDSLARDLELVLGVYLANITNGAKPW